MSGTPVPENGYTYVGSSDRSNKMSESERRLRDEIARYGNCLLDFSRREDKQLTNEQIVANWQAYTHGMSVAFRLSAMFMRIALETKEDLLAGIDPPIG